MTVLQSGLIPSTEAGYQISRSLRFNSADSAYLNRTPGVAGNRKTWTWSGWVKRSQLSSSASFGLFEAYSASVASNSFIFYQDTLFFQFDQGATNIYWQTPAIFRDVSAWYHLVIALDTTQASSANAVKIYVNGVQQTITFVVASGSYVQNTDYFINSTNAHSIGRYIGASYFNGYLTEINFIDGQALTPSSFGETNQNTGVWQPKKYTGTYGTNGFYLNFSDNSGTTSTTLGKDYSGNGNNWTPNNFSVTAGAGNDSLVDTPTSYGTDTGVGGEVRGNYATWNPLPTVGDTDHPTFSEGNLKVAFSNWGFAGPLSTIALQAQNTYCEITCAAVGNGGNSGVGIAQLDADLSGNVIPTKCVTYGANGNKCVSAAFSAYGSSFTTGDIIGIAYNSSSNEVTFYKNNVSQGALSLSTLSGSLFFCCHATSGSITWEANFGQRPFAYTAPSGFKALCTQNLPTPTIGATSTTTANKYFNPLLWTANGGVQSITGMGFRPDFLWIKDRQNANSHYLQNTVVGASTYLLSDSTNAEVTNANNVSSIDSNGFSMGSANYANGRLLVAWGWNAASSNATNTSGTITSTVRANTTAGFSIVSYSLQASGSKTVGHGLGVAPSLIITKPLTTGNVQPSSWFVYHSSVGATAFLILNTTAAATTNSTLWDNTAPTSSVFTVGSGFTTANYGTTQIAYCFAPVAGFSAFGSYTGNGSTDGSFVFTGHRPAFLLIKRTDTTSNWTLFDFKRAGYNVDNDQLYPNLSNAEATTDLVDLLSNGFKLRSTDASVNASGGTYIYMSLATNPFKYSLAQ